MEELTQEQIIQRGNQTEDMMRTSWWKNWYAPALEQTRQDVLEMLLYRLDGESVGKVKQIDQMREQFDGWIRERNRILLQKKQETDNAE